MAFAHRHSMHRNLIRHFVQSNKIRLPSNDRKLIIFCPMANCYREPWCTLYIYSQLSYIYFFQCQHAVPHPSSKYIQFVSIIRALRHSYFFPITYNVNLSNSRTTLLITLYLILAHQTSAQPQVYHVVIWPLYSQECHIQCIHIWTEQNI